MSAIGSDRYLSTLGALLNAETRHFLGTFAAGGGHHGLVMKYRDDAERLRRPMLVAAGIIVNSLVDHDFSGVERMTDGRYLTATDLEHAIAGIGGTLMSAPVFSYDDLTFEAVADDPPTFETRIPLWTAEHGRTKTVLILRFHEWEGIHDVVQSQVVGVTASVG